MISVNGERVIVEHFPDGTQKININAKQLKCINMVTWKYENDEEMLTLLYVSKFIKSKPWTNTIHLYMAYVPNARMDRIKGDNEIFTLKYFCDFINYLEFDSVIILDPHSDVSKALINNVTILTPKKWIEKAIEKVSEDNLVIFYPDNGSAKRYSDRLNRPYCYGVKSRDWQTGEILGLDVITNGIDLKGKNILIVDDICSKGGTFYYSALKLKELGVNDIYLYVSHCENTIGKGELLKDNGLIKRIFTTDSIYSLENDKVEVIKNV